MSTETKQKPNRAELLAQVEADAATADNLVATLILQRDKAILAGEDVDHLDIELDRARRAATAKQDRIRLLGEQFADEDRQRQAKDIARLIDRMEAKLRERDQFAAELERDLRQIIGKFCAIHELNMQVLAAAPGLPGGGALAGQLTRTSLVRLLESEIYRISGVPFVGGGSGVDRPPPFPGGRCPSVTDPRVEVIAPLSTAMREASDWLIREMRKLLPQEEKAA